MRRLPWIPIAGFGLNSYLLALDALAGILKGKKS